MGQECVVAEILGKRDTRAAGSQRREEAPPAAPGLRTAASVGGRQSLPETGTRSGGPASAVPRQLGREPWLQGRSGRVATAT